MPTENDPNARRYVALYHGVVVANNDPLILGRVRVRIAGLVEPATRWAFPFATSGGGEKNRGGYWVPKNGSEVVVLFNQGDPDFPYYAPAHWGNPRGVRDTPSFVTEQSDVTPEDAPLISGWEMDRFVFYFDDRPGKQSFQLRDKVSGDGISYDSTTRCMQVKSTTMLKIVADGAIDIDALTVTILGRSVTPGDQSI